MRLSATDMIHDYSVGAFAIEVALSNDRSWPIVLKNRHGQVTSQLSDTGVGKMSH